MSGIRVDEDVACKLLKQMQLQSGHAVAATAASNGDSTGNDNYVVTGYFKEESDTSNFVWADEFGTQVCLRLFAPIALFARFCAARHSLS